jgi:hypothetical protein
MTNVFTPQLQKKHASVTAATQQLTKVTWCPGRNSGTTDKRMGVGEILGNFLK